MKTGQLCDVLFVTFLLFKYSNLLFVPLFQMLTRNHIRKSQSVVDWTGEPLLLIQFNS